MWYRGKSYTEVRYVFFAFLAGAFLGMVVLAFYVTHC